MTNNADNYAIEAAGLHILPVLYGLKPKDKNLNQMHLQIFSKKVASSSMHVKPEALPSTEDAARFHSCRVHHQVQKWLGYELNQVEWGWELWGKILIPQKQRNHQLQPQFSASHSVWMHQESVYHNAMQLQEAGDVV